MSRRSTNILPGSRDGTSQRSRRMAALDPAHAPIDERTTADVLGFVQVYAAQLRFLEGDDETGGVRTTGMWADFARRDDISIADIVAYLADPARFTGERARWLGRPHFALLLTFVQLLAHARDHLNGFTRRHLDHYYRDVLQIRPEPPAPDRATVVFGLRPGAPEVRLPAGTELQAGRDAGGVPRIYRTEREIIVNRAAVAQVRSVFVDRRITGISDVRADRSLTAPQALTQTLAIALGSPGPGDPVPAWKTQAVDTAFLTGLRGVLDFAPKSLYLEHHEIRSMMQLVAQRRDADPEWVEINRLLGVTSPAKPRDFPANLTARVGVLDFAADGLPQVGSVDDLYTYRGEPAVRAYIDDRLSAVGFDNFIAAMQIKLRIDAAWAEINRLLERAGRRQRDVLSWSLPPGDATDFAGNLAAALQGKWPPPWPSSPSATTGIDDYDALLRRLEVHLSMPVERIAILVAFAEQIGHDAQSEHHDWSDVDRILGDAYGEKLRAARVTQLVAVRAGGQDAAAFDKVASFVLGATAPLSWTDARPHLADHLDRSQLDRLAQFRDGLVTSEPSFGFGWSDAEALFELAWRNVQQLPEPIAQKIEVRNLYAYDDATQVKASAAAPGWKTLGQRPLGADATHPRGATLGWALRSPLLSLREGTRTLTLTLGLRGDGFAQAEQVAFLAALGLGATERSGDKLARALEAALAIEVSTAKGWIGLGLATARLATGAAGDDYWSLRGVALAVDDHPPALQLQAIVDRTADPLAPLEGDPQIWPALRLSLRPRWNSDAREWQSSSEAFAPLVLSAVHLKVEVEGLAALRLQQDDRLLDPRKPLEPFGSRPAVGARLYLDHPELVRARLDSLRFDIEWMGLPAGALKDYYVNYPGLTGDSGVFKARVAVVDRDIEAVLADLSLFVDQAGKTQPARALAIADVPAALQTTSPGFVYDRRSDLAPASDVRQASRYLRWELTPVDFGHGVNASLAASKARELAVAMAAGTVKTAADAAAYRVEPPYTPTIKTLRVAYATTVEIDVAAAASEHQILHAHPFGLCPIDAELPSLLPRYDAAGELYIGVRDLQPPQHLALLLQVAEGTSDPDIEPAAVTWSYLDGDRFRDLSGTGIVDDTTRGLRNAGIVELALPAAASGSRLPPDLYWLRLAVPRNPTSVCDLVAIQAQAVSARFDDRGNAAAHYEQPLPVGAIERMLDPDARIARIEQPYSSSGGRPAEPPDLLDTRVSERLRHKMRALTAWDYERLVLHRFRQIYKARCLSSPGGVDVIVIPDLRELHPRDTLAPRAPANLLADIQAYLVERAPAAARIRVRNARYVAVRVHVGVRFRDGIDAGFAQRRLNDDLIRFLSPWAFDDGAELTIGGRIYANSILDFIDRRDDVDFVADIKLFRSLDGSAFDLVPPVVGEYHVATDRPDQVLVAAPQHFFNVIPETGYQQASFTGIHYARIELDFIVG
jgi:hypothetical protein